MNLTKNHPPRKREGVRHSPHDEEGLYIQFLLKTKKKSFTRIGESLGVSNQAVANVVSGRRRSRRIESEIACILGKADWNEVVLEARSEIKKKPVEVIVREMEQKVQAETKARKEEFYSDPQAVFARQDWSAHLKAQREETAKAQAKDGRKKKGVAV